MEIELGKAKALLLAQQYELNRLQNSVNYYKNELKISKKHRMNIKNNCLHIKVREVVFILSINSVQFIGKKFGKNYDHNIIVHGNWINLTKNKLEFVSLDGNSRFIYEKKNIIERYTIFLNIPDHDIIWRTSYSPSVIEEDMYIKNIDKFISTLL